MRHVFLINPAAGKYDRTGEFTQTIRAACEGLDYEILVSRAPGDCTHIAQAAASSGEPVRLYACGGDGTLNEVVNGGDWKLPGHWPQSRSCCCWMSLLPV